MIKNLLKSMHTDNGKFVLSIILGFGFASLFRKVCKDRKCLVFRAPALDEVSQSIYEHNNKCYKFTEKSTTCLHDENEDITFA